MKKLAVLLLIIIGTLSTFAQNVHPNFVDGVIYVQFADDFPLNFKVDDKTRAVSPSEFPFLAEIFEKYELLGMSQSLYLNNNPNLLRTLRVHFGAVEKVDDFIKELSQFKQVKFAEKLPLYKLCAVYPNDPLFATSGNRWYLDKIFAKEVWNDLNVRGTSDVKVAVLDNAVWGEHPDLSILPENLCHFSLGASYTIVEHVGSANPPASVNQNQECTVSDIYDENCPAYDWSHGTHCAGLVGARNNNGIGNASIGGGATLMGANISDNYGGINIFYSYEGVQWAARNGANIISMSYGSPEKTTIEEQVMQTAYNMGVILLASAGNNAIESQFPGHQPNFKSYPACYSSVISVAAIDGNGKLSSFSEHGEGRADIAAPGGSSTSGKTMLSTTFCKTQLWTTDLGDEVYYDGMQGTSMACPLTAGLCALLVSVYPDITPAQVKECLQTTAQPLASGSNTIDGNGYINAYTAVLCAKSKNPDPDFVNPNPPAGINDEAAHNCTLFPNPTAHAFTIVRTTARAQVAEIFDFTGKLIKTLNLTDEATTVDVSNFPNGIYFVKVGNWTGKLIVSA